MPQVRTKPSHLGLQQPSQKLQLQAVVLLPHSVRTQLARAQMLGEVATPLQHPQRRGKEMMTQPARLPKPVLMLPGARLCKPPLQSW